MTNDPVRSGPPVGKQEIEAQAAPPAAPSAVPTPPSIFLNPAVFETAQRAARALVMSPLVPEHYRVGGKNSLEQAMANTLIALNIADKMGEDPLTIMQNLHVIGGKPGWDTAYMIARANRSGRFREEIDWEEEHIGDMARYRVRAFAVRHNGKRVYGSWVSMAMAKEEGWTRNPKYRSMPDHMLRYRAAAFFINQVCPEVMGAVRRTVDELQDLRVVGESRAARPEPAETTKALKRQALPEPDERKRTEALSEMAEHNERSLLGEPEFPEPKDDFNPGQFTADAMAHIRNAQSATALSALLARWDTQLPLLKQRAPRSYEAVMDAVSKRNREVAS